MVWIATHALKLDNLLSFRKIKDHSKSITGQNMNKCPDVKWFSSLNHRYFKIRKVCPVLNLCTYLDTQQ